MVKRIRFPKKIFFGWWTVLAGGITTLLIGGYGAYGISALFKPISSELGFSRAATSTASSISRLEGGIEGPIAGWATDKFGPKWVIIGGAFLVGLALVLMYFINSLWAFLVVWGVVLGTGNNISTSLPFDTAIANWFVKKRGLAISIKWFVSGFSATLMLPLIAWLIITQGWRTTCLIGGIAVWVIVLPLVWFTVKQHRPEYYGLLPDGATAKEATKDAGQMLERGMKYASEVGETEFTLRQAVRTPAFWLLSLVNASRGLAMPVFNIHAVPFLTDIGVAPLLAAGLLAMMVTVGLPMRLVGGFLADRLSKNRLRFALAGAYALEAIGFGIFLLNKSLPMVYVWFIVYGLGNGIIYGLGEPLRARYFGRKAFGSIRGATQLIMTPVGIAAPVYAGWVYDTTGSYFTVFNIIAVVLTLSAVFSFFVLPPKAPADTGDVRKIM